MSEDSRRFPGAKGGGGGEDGRGACLRGFPPAGALGDPEPKFLVLGSFPSVRSLERREYYGNPKNHFWRIVSRCFGLTEPSSYEGKLAMLREARIALWDVYAACVRPGSLDADISDPVPNPVAEFLGAHLSIEAVGANGGEAARALAACLGTGVRGAAGLGRLARAGDHALWTPGGGGAGSPRAEKPVLVARLPSTSPVPTAAYRSAEDKLPAWERFFTIRM